MEDRMDVGLRSSLNKVQKPYDMDQMLYIEKEKSSNYTEMTIEVVEPTKKELADSNKWVNQSLKIVNTALEISLDKEVNDKVVRVLNTISGEVIRQIPSKDFLEWEKEYTKLLGILFDKKV